MKKNNLIYFVFIAPILAKILEWIIGVQWGSIGSIWLGQLGFIVFLSALVYFFMISLFSLKKNSGNWALIPSIAYFLKEVYNLLTVTHTANWVALVVEPVFMYTIVGKLIPYLLWRKK